MAEATSLDAAQRAVCEKHGSAFVATPASAKVGVALATVGLSPLYGLRSLPIAGTSGWFLWGGGFSTAPDFFQPLHAGHLSERLPLVEKYLGLVPSYGFIIDAAGYEDVWYDPDRLAREDGEGRNGG